MKSKQQIDYYFLNNRNTNHLVRHPCHVCYDYQYKKVVGEKLRNCELPKTLRRYLEAVAWNIKHIYSAIIINRLNKNSLQPTPLLGRIFCSIRLGRCPAVRISPISLLLRYYCLLLLPPIKFVHNLPHSCNLYYLYCNNGCIQLSQFILIPLNSQRLRLSMNLGAHVFLERDLNRELL